MLWRDLCWLVLSDVLCAVFTNTGCLVLAVLISTEHNVQQKLMTMSLVLQKSLIWWWCWRRNKGVCWLFSCPLVAAHKYRNSQQKSKRLNVITASQLFFMPLWQRQTGPEALRWSGARTASSPDILISQERFEGFSSSFAKMSPLTQGWSD